MKSALPQRLLTCGLAALIAFAAQSALAQDEAAARAALRGAAAESTPDVDEDEDVLVVIEGEEEGTDEKPLAARSEEMKRRAGEQIGREPVGRANILGMFVQESDERVMRVVEVGAATPAFNAGIRKGDIILSFDGFTADSYRKWIDGIRKLMTAAPDGDTMAVEIERDGQILNLRVRKAESRGPAVQFETPQTLAQPQPPAGDAAIQQQLVPYANQPQQPSLGYGGDNLLGVNFFGGQFDETLGGTTQRAVAEIFRIGTASTPGQQQIAGTLRRGQPTARTDVDLEPRAIDQPVTDGVGTRIGLAGFRNEQTGLLVMLDVGGLSPGQYIVSIDDPSMIAAGMSGNRGTVGGRAGERLRAGSDVGVGDAVGTPPQTVPPQTAPPQTVQPGTQPTPGVGRPQNRPIQRPSPGGGGAPPSVTPSPTQPIQRPSPESGTPDVPETRPQGQQGQSSARGLIPQTVLAQVVADPAAGGAGATDVPPTGAGTPPQTRGPATTQIPPTSAQSGAVDVPATGLPTGTTDIPESGLPAVRDGRDVPEQLPPSAVDRSGQISGGPAGFAGRPNQIGVLIVDQTGTGHMQQIVEGVQVADVLGLAIVIWVPTAEPAGRSTATGAAAPTLDNVPPSVRPGRAVDQPLPTRSGGGLNRPAGAAVPQGTEGMNVNAGLPFGGPMPIAAGIIRTVSDRTPADAVGQQPAQEVLR